jgi:hypothetical protein
MARTSWRTAIKGMMIGLAAAACATDALADDVMVTKPHPAGRRRQSTRASRNTRNRTMKMKYFLAALLLIPSLAAPAMVQARPHDTSIPPRAIEGREVTAPSWSAACMTDQGPSQCGEPMWVYGSPGRIARYKNAF